MTILTIITAPDPRLRVISEPVDQISNKDKTLMNDMLETMYSAPGVGLSAIQVGIAKRIIVIDTAGQNEKPEPLKIINPKFISKSETNSKLLISNFKVSKVPALAQLLTLASLRGIADTLSGEGIMFESFEMKSNSKDNTMNIEDALAMGPAVSILLEGYVEKNKTVSLRGTLVPATKLNAIIASIPLVGDILVGKKTGDGVVGVSFKMKGPPKDIKTTVNPIKTITPRFIVRAVEKMKKKKKEEIK